MSELSFVGHGHASGGSMWKSPLVWGIALFGGVAIVMLTRGSGGGGGANLSAISLQAANAANVQLSGLALQGHAIDVQASSANYAAGQTALSTLMGQAFGFMTNSNNNATALAGQAQQISGAVQINQDNQGAAIQLDAQANKNRVDLASIGAGTSVKLAGIGAQNSTDLAQINARATLDLQSLKNALSSLVLGNSVQLAQIDATSKLALTNAGWSGATSYGQGVTIPLAGIQSDTQKSLADTQSKTQIKLMDMYTDMAVDMMIGQQIGGIFQSAIGGYTGGSAVSGMKGSGGTGTGSTGGGTASGGMGMGSIGGGMLGSFI